MTIKHIEATAVGQGYYRVFVNGEQKSRHVAEREAMESAGKSKRDNPSSTVYYDHDYQVRIDLVDAPVVLPTPEPEPPVVVVPTPVPEPEPPVVVVPTPEPEPPVVVVPPPAPTGRITASRFRLIGGWRINQPYCRGGLAIDFSSGKAYIGGHTQKNEIWTHDLPAMGVGEDVSQWPMASGPSEQLPKFWDVGFCRGIMLRDGKLWVSTKIFYDTSPKNVVLSSLDLSTGETTQTEVPLGKPAFGGGFIKGDPSRFMIGCGGYESGQGSVAGPTCALADGTVLLNQANHGAAFELRELRTPNYSAATDSWAAINPRDGVGRWTVDRVYGGGIWRPDGLVYWSIQAVGDVDYKRQSETFSVQQQSMLYTYDPQSFDQVAFEPWSHGFVNGQEVDADGRVYLLTRDAFRISSTRIIPAIKVFEVI
jgi:hypothetical protein